MAANGLRIVSEQDFQELKERCKAIAEAGPKLAPTDSELRRYLRAFGNVDTAFTKMVLCYQWRQEFGVEKITADDSYIKQELASGEVSFLHNRDGKGRPIIYVLTRKRIAAEKDLEQSTRFLVYCLETLCNKCDETVIDNICVVYNLRGLSLANLDYPFVKRSLSILNERYPERLGLAILLNAPAIFKGFWAIIRPWMDEYTARKFVFVNEQADLLQYLNPDALPADDD